MILLFEWFPVLLGHTPHSHTESDFEQFMIFKFQIVEHALHHIPLLPLTEGGAGWDVVQGMLHDLEFEDHELLKIAFGMAMRCVSEEHREPLKKEYHVIYDELRADPLFREMLNDERKEGRQEGAIQTAQEIAICLVASRFPELEKFARIIIAAVSDVERLQMLIIELSIASSEDHAKQLLFSLASDG